MERLPRPVKFNTISPVYHQHKTGFCTTTTHGLNVLNLGNSRHMPKVFSSRRQPAIAIFNSPQRRSTLFDFDNYNNYVHYFAKTKKKEVLSPFDDCLSLDDLSEISSGENGPNDLDELIFTSTRQTVFSDPSFTDSFDQEDDGLNELWRENFVFDSSEEVRRDGPQLGGQPANYPRLQSSFYRQLRKKYPIAFHRFNGDAASYQDTASCENGTDRGHTGRMSADPTAGQDVAVRKCDAPDKRAEQKSGISVKDKLKMNSRSMHVLLYEQMPFKDQKAKSHLSRSEHETSHTRMTNGVNNSSEAVDLRHRITQNNSQLQVYRTKLEKSARVSDKKSTKSDKLTVMVDVHDVLNPETASDAKSVRRKLMQKSSPDRGGNGESVSPESPPDSAIDMDSASLQSIMSGLADHGHLSYGFVPAWDTLDPLISPMEKDGHHTDQPNGGHHTDQANGGHHTDQPNRGHHTDQPNRGHYTDQPNRGHHTDQPNGGHYTDQPNGGHYTDQPSRGHHTDQPNGAHYTDQPIRGHHTDQPIMGHHADQPNGLSTQQGWIPEGASVVARLLNGADAVSEQHEQEVLLSEVYTVSQPEQMTNQKRVKSSVQDRRQSNLLRELELERLSAELNRHCSQLVTDEDDELLMSLTTDLLSRRTVKPQSHPEDELDDTDPRRPAQEPPTDAELERQIAERYRRKKASRAKSKSRLQRPLSGQYSNGNRSDKSKVQSESESLRVFPVQRSVSRMSDELRVPHPADWDIRTESETNIQGQGMNSRLFECDSNEYLPHSERNSPKLVSDMSPSHNGENNTQPSVLHNEEFQGSGPEGSLPEMSRTHVSKVIESSVEVSTLHTVESNSVSALRNSTEKQDGGKNISNTLPLEDQVELLPLQKTSSAKVALPQTENPDLPAKPTNDPLPQENSLDYSAVESVNSASGSVRFSEPSECEPQKSEMSPNAKGILRHNSSLGSQLTPYEVSVCVEKLSPKKKGEDLGKIYSARQIVIDKSDSELGDADVNQVPETQSNPLKTRKNSSEVKGDFADHIEMQVFPSKGDNPIVKSHSGGDNSVSSSTTTHYKKRNPTEAEQKRNKVLPKKVLSGDNGLNLVLGHDQLRASNPCLASTSSQIDQVDVEGSKYQKSNLQSSRDLSASKLSLLQSARARIQLMKKAKSLNHLDQPDADLEMVDKENRRNSALTMMSQALPPPPPPPGRMKKATSFKSLLNFGRKSKHGSQTSKPSHRSTPISFLKRLRKPSSVQNVNVGVDVPTHPRAIGRLVELRPDGTQTVELTRPPHGPFGIYIGRATAQYNYSVFVTRFSDGHPEKLFAGLLSVGDEILEINDKTVRNLSLDEVYNLMGSGNTMVLKTVPVWCRDEYANHHS